MTMDIPADAEKYKQLLIEKFPHERAGIENLFKELQRIDIAMQTGIEFMQGNYLKGIWRSITSPAALWTMIKYRNSSTTSLVNDFLKDRALIIVFTALINFLGEGNDSVSGIIFAAMWNSYHSRGYYYFEGGSQSVSKALADVVMENGGEISLSTRAVKIIIENGRAKAVRAENLRTKEVREYTCRYVVSNANAPDTFFKLVGEENLPADYVSRLKSMEIGPSTFCVYMGVKKDYANYYPEHVHGIMVYDFIDEADNVKAVKEGDITKISFGIANYTVLNPDSAPKGKNTICMVCVMPYNTNDGWKLNGGYDKYTKYKKEIGIKFAKRAERFLPGLTSNIEVMEVGTPVTNRNYTSNPNGTIFGWANTPAQSLTNRLPQDTPIDNLYLAGAWTLPCGGQSAVLISGCLAAGMILND
jgi:phytoene dehydrogenase-like protein